MLSYGERIAKNPVLLFFGCFLLICLVSKIPADSTRAFRDYTSNKPYAYFEVGEMRILPGDPLFKKLAARKYNYVFAIQPGYKPKSKRSSEYR